MRLGGLSGISVRALQCIPKANIDYFNKWGNIYTEDNELVEESAQLDEDGIYYYYNSSLVKTQISVQDAEEYRSVKHNDFYYFAYPVLKELNIYKKYIASSGANIIISDKEDRFHSNVMKQVTSGSISIEPALIKSDVSDKFYVVIDGVRYSDHSGEYYYKKNIDGDAYLLDFSSFTSTEITALLNDNNAYSNASSQEEINNAVSTVMSDYNAIFTCFTVFYDMSEQKFILRYGFEHNLEDYPSNRYFRVQTLQPIDSVVSDSLRPHGLQPARLLCPWGFSRQEY